MRRRHDPLPLRRARGLPIRDIPAGLTGCRARSAASPNSARRCSPASRRKPALAAGARARATISALMMLEWWAYVLDVVAFYDGEIAQEALPAHRPPRRLAAPPRRADRLHAAPAAGRRRDARRVRRAGPAVIVPAGTGFRSDAFDGEPPQVFESEAEQATSRHASTNGRSRRSRRRPFDAGTSACSRRAARASARGSWCSLEWAKREARGDGGEGRDPAPARWRDLSGADARSGAGDPREPARRRRSPEPPGAAGGDERLLGELREPTSSNVSLTLDALYPQIRIGDRGGARGHGPGPIVHEHHFLGLAALGVARAGGGGGFDDIGPVMPLQ